MVKWGRFTKLFKNLFTFRSMKNRFIHCLLIFLLFQAELEAQPQTDSITFFTGKVLKPNQSDDLLQAYVFFERQNNWAEKAADTLSQLYNLYMLSLITIVLGWCLKVSNMLCRIWSCSMHLHHTVRGRKIICAYTTSWGDSNASFSTRNKAFPIIPTP